MRSASVLFYWVSWNPANISVSYMVQFICLKLEGYVLKHFNVLEIEWSHWFGLYWKSLKYFFLPLLIHMPWSMLEIEWCLSTSFFCKSWVCVNAVPFYILTAFGIPPLCLTCQPSWFFFFFFLNMWERIVSDLYQ